MKESDYIEIDLGDGWLIRAKRIDIESELLKKDQEIFASVQTLSEETPDAEDLQEALRDVLSFLGCTYSFVVVEWQHPNYGYFADAGFFWRSLHSITWRVQPIAVFFLEFPNYVQFIQKFPEFEKLFD